jgi:ribosomal protein L11 methyltransferase
LEARYLLKSRPALLQDAQALADSAEYNLKVDPLAVSVVEIDEHQGLWQTLFYFNSQPAAFEALSALRLASAVIENIPQTDWVRESLAGLAPVTAGRFFVHGSHDWTRRRAGGVSIEIDAQTAFGTGHHGTTSGCLLALDRLLKQRRIGRALDLGCGTGVLAIAAARAGARFAVGTDIDVEAVTVAKQNASLNGVSDRFRCVVADGTRHPLLIKSQQFDLVFANILAGPLVKMAPGIVPLISPGGTLILSGLTAQQVNWVKSPYLALGLTFRDVRLFGSWATLTLEKQKTRRIDAPG